MSQPMRSLNQISSTRRIPAVAVGLLLLATCLRPVMSYSAQEAGEAAAKKESPATTTPAEATAASEAEAKSEKPADNAVADPEKPASVSETPAAAPDQPKKEPPPIPLELQPYRVRISVAFDDHASFSAQFRQDVLAELTTWVDRTYSEMWQAEIEANEWLLPANVDGLSRLTWPQVDAQLANPALDKAFVVCVSVHGGVIRLSGREWDRMTQQLSVRNERIVGDRRAVASELGLVLRDLFHPLLLIEKLEGKLATVRVRAGEFPAGDPAADQLAEGSFFQPVLLYFNKQHEVQKTQLIPWSYLAVESSSRAVGKCSIQTSLRVPLGKNTKRLESWAIGVRPTLRETRFRITPHNNPTKPLIGYQVTVFEKRMVPAPQDAPPAAAADKSSETKADAAKDAEGKSADEKPAEEKKVDEPPPLVAQLNKLHELVTDRRGQVIVPFDSDRQLIWLYVSSGGNLVGRFPYIPGLAPVITAELPDDSLRLLLESQLELLRADFIDTVAKRALLLARAKASAKSADWPRFEETLADLERQPTARLFGTQLDAIKVSTAKKAQEKKDRSLERRIDRLCKETAELIEQHLNVDKLKEQHDELVELRKVEQEAAAAESDTTKPRANVPKRAPTAK